MVRTFGRIVSLPDFEDVARETTGIAKARATMVWNGEEQVAQLTVAGEGGTRIVGNLMDRLVSELDARRDRNRQLVVSPHEPLHLAIELLVVVDMGYLASDVAASCHNALLEHLSFERQDFGRAVHLSDIYAVTQSVPGVTGVTVEALHVKPDPGAPRPAESRIVEHLPVGSHELAAIKDAGDVVVRTEGGGR